MTGIATAAPTAAATGAAARAASDAAPRAAITAATQTATAANHISFAYVDSASRSRPQQKPSRNRVTPTSSASPTCSTPSAVAYPAARSDVPVMAEEYRLTHRCAPAFAAGLFHFAEAARTDVVDEAAHRFLVRNERVGGDATD
jgi:hypothetical protein